jgi:hypothetical protein
MAENSGNLDGHSTTFGEYLPKSFCREYVEAKGNAVQLGLFMAVALGFKPLMDDWVSADGLDAFRKACRKYKLHICEDIVFENVPREVLPEDILGKGYLTTTSAYGHPLGSAKSGQEVHVFVSKDKSALRKRMWYPVIIGKRVILQPMADSLGYGEVLGYPKCCIRFFRKYNNWLKYNHLYEAYLNTKAEPHFLCNPFLKDTAFSYIYHMPCSYSCPQTMEMAGALRREIKKREPEYVRLTDELLHMPFLVFYEKKYYAFQGTLNNNEVSYSRFYFTSPEANKDLYSRHLRQADTLRLEARELVFIKKGKVTARKEVSRNNFAPEFPFFMQYRG